MRFISTLLASLFLPAALHAEAGLDVNDVAVLFPNDGLHKPIPYIALDDPNLIPVSVLQTVLNEATAIGIKPPQTTAMAKPSDWSVRAYRVDPCAPEEHGKSLEPCLFELRLVAQPTARFSPADSTIHLMYKLGSGKPSADHPLLKDLLALKKTTEELSQIKTAGQPLGVHPALVPVVKSKRTDIPNLFASFIRKYAKQEALSKITMMGLRNGSPTNWVFFGGDVIEGKWVPTPVPNRKVLRGAKHFVEINVIDGQESFKGQALDPKLALDQFFNETPENISASLEAIAEAAFTLENPSLTDRNNTDCVSCHAATSTRLATEYVFPTDIPGVTTKVPKGITAFPALGTIQNHPLHWNLRAFGYFGLSPTVSMRTVHEAGRSAVELNEILGLTAPGPDCSTREQAVLQCLVSGTLEPGTIGDSAACLKECKSQTR